MLFRSLSPVGYGDLFFLIGSFAAVCALMDLGTSSAFYTFIAQRIRSRAYIVLYFVWLAIQFFVIVLFIVAILPSSLIDKIWLGHSIDIIVLAFIAMFLQQKVWTTVMQICESARLTIIWQLTVLGAVFLHLLIVLWLIYIEGISVNSVLISLSAVYLSAAIIVWVQLHRQRRNVPHHVEEIEFDFKSMCFEYWVYCKPMIVIAIFSFLYEFADRWLLQRFGGAEQQGFYQISAQFAAVSLLATASILNIFWKEIAEAFAQDDTRRVERLYQKVSRGLIMLGAAIACFLVPWAEQISLLLLGEAYAVAWPVLAVMFLYPIHQSMGQINAAMYMACERTKPYMNITLFGMFISIPVTYLMLVPSDGGWLLSGLGLGALGLAIKMLGLNVLLVNVQAWMLARYHGWKYEWLYQVIAVSSMLGIGYFVKMLVGLMWDIDLADVTSLIAPLLFSCLVYVVAVIIVIWVMPWLAGLEREEISRLINKLRRGDGRVHS